MSYEPSLKYTKDNIGDVLEDAWPNWRESGYDIQELSTDFISIRTEINDNMKRLGGTVSGPSIFRIFDGIPYLHIMALNGHDGAMAVTTNMNINFLRRASDGYFIAESRMTKMGKRLIVSDLQLINHTPDGHEKLIATASCSYMMP